MTMDFGPFCVHCGRPTRFSMNDVYQCKQGCDQAAAEAAAGLEAARNLQTAEDAVAQAGQRITMAAPAPPSLELTGTPEHVIELLEEHPELEASVPVTEPEPETEEAAPEPEPEVASAPSSQPRPRGKRRRR